MYHGIVQPLGFPGLPAGWSTDWQTFQSADGRAQLFAALHSDEVALKKGSKPRALVILHGMGEHGGRYLHVAHFLGGAVNAVYCPDHRGHGRSDGLRGHIENFDSMADDAALAVRRLSDELMRRYGSAEIHLLGHSLGGHVALRTLFLHPDLPLATASVSAPFLGIKQRVPVSKRMGARVLNQVWGQLQLETGLDVTKISHDEAVVEAYRKDRLNHGKMTPRFYNLMLAAFKDTLARTSGITPPIQFLVPMADEIVDAAVTLAFYEKLEHPHKRLRQYEGFFHEPFNEIGKEAVFADLAEWMRMHSRV